MRTGMVEAPGPPLLPVGTAYILRYWSMIFLTS